MSSLPAGVRESVRARADGCCEYCLHQEAFSSDSFTVDHIVPRSRDGGDGLDNLSFACAGCNGRKYNKIEAIDPVTGRDVPLFHPRKDEWSAHFRWLDGDTRVVGMSPTGRATVSELDLNRDGLLRLRSVLAAAGRHPPGG